MRKQKGNRKHAPWRGLAAMGLCAVLVVALAGTSLAAQTPGEEGFLSRQVTALARALGWQPTGAKPLTPVTPPKGYDFADWESRQQLIEERPVSEAFLAAQADFAYATAAQVMGGAKENVSYSPLSLYYALALAATGGEGETAAELLDLLGVESKEALAAQSANLYCRLYWDNEIGTLRIANSLWMNQGVPWKQAFADQAAQSFYAPCFQEDFSDPATARKMSAWVAGQTGGLLQPEISLDDPQQILSILNAVYFRDQWVDRFSEDQTQPDAFTRADGTQVTCDFMNRTDPSTGFSKGENYLRASLSLKNAGSMLFVLPDRDASVGDLLADSKTLRDALTGGEERWGEVVWKIPKFDSGSKLDLKKALQALGVTHAFQPDADFSAITDQAAWIGGVQQETRVTVNEEGVSAAAFTEISYCGAALPEDRGEMILDRPFLYAITSPDGGLLFLGVCQDPTV